MKLHELAERLGARVEGDAQVEVTAVAGIEEADERSITFLTNQKYAGAVRSTRAAAIIVGDDFPAGGERPLLRSANPYLTFAKAIELFYAAPRFARGVHPTAIIDPTASIGK